MRPLLIPVLFCLLALCAPAALAQAEISASAAAGRDKPSMTVALAENDIEVNVDFSGAKISLFAATSMPHTADVSYAVALVGPRRAFAITRTDEDGEKRRMEFISAPTVLSVATEEELRDIASPDVLIRADLHDRYAAKVGPDDVDDPELDAFRDAFVALQRENGLFNTSFGDVTRLGGGLLRGDIFLPAAAPPGDYDVRLFMFRDKILLAEAEAPLSLTRHGAENTFWSMAHKLPVLYGIFSVCVGVAFGGVGAAMGRRS